MTAWTFFEGKWQEGNVPIMGSTTHAAWLSSVVFDGARAFDGLVPDLERHAERVVNSAHAMGLKPTKTKEEIVELSLAGVKKFPPMAELYIRPMFFGTTGFVVPEPDSTAFALVVNEAPLPANKGFAACLSTRRRPSRDSAPTDAKAGCLYPNAARALREAYAKGFDNGVTLDQNGNVAEFATANLFIVKDGIAQTPVINGTFLNGITRQRIISLLSDAGTEVVEKTVTWEDVTDADEVFSTGNFAKVAACTRIEDRHLQPGPVSEKARDLYWEFARSQPAA